MSRVSVICGTASSSLIFRQINCQKRGEREKKRMNKTIAKINETKHCFLRR